MRAPSLQSLPSGHSEGNTGTYCRNSLTLRWSSAAECRQHEQVHSDSCCPCHAGALKHVHPSSGRALNCDKETLGQSIRLWFGSVDAFDTFVQQDVLFAFNKTFASYGLPYSWLAGATVPVVWCGVAYYIPQDDAFSGNLLPEFSTVFLGLDLTSLSPKASNALFFLPLTATGSQSEWTQHRIWLLCWWLAYIPIMVLLWMKVVYAFRARRSYQVSEAGSC